MPGRMQSPSAQLGELLLRGWCMQAEACKDCQLPLMRDPATMLSHCVGCKKVYNPDGNIVQEDVQQVPQAAAVSAQQSPPAAAGAGAAGRPTMNGPISSAASSSFQPAAQAIAITANGTPANATQQQQQPDEDPDFEQVQQRYLQMRRQREATGAAAAAAGGSNDPSQLLADKLLEGWTMLGQHCPICNSPLMRSRAMQVRCVVCDLPVQVETSSATRPAASQQAGEAGSTPEQAAGTGSTARQRAVVAGSTAGQAGSAGGTIADQAIAGQPSSTGSTAAADGSGRNAVGDQCSRSERLMQLAPTTHVIAPSATAVEQAHRQQQQSWEQPRSWEQQQQAAGGMGHGSGGNLLLQQQRVLSGLQRALLQKLDDSRQLLAATAATQTDDLAKQLHVINQLMQTFAVVKQEMPR